MEGLDKRLVEPRVVKYKAMAKLLRRYTSLNHLCGVSGCVPPPMTMATAG